MLNCLYFLNPLISPPIYSPSISFPNNPSYRQLLKCPPAQSIYYGLQRENNESNTISPSNNEKLTQNASLTSKKFTIDTNKKRPIFQKGDHISVYYKNTFLGRGTFHSQDKSYFIWHDAEGNERFQMKHILITIKKL